jgi:hypothetical protein
VQAVHCTAELQSAQESGLRVRVGAGTADARYRQYCTQAAAERGQKDSGGLTQTGYFALWLATWGKNELDHCPYIGIAVTVTVTPLEASILSSLREETAAGGISAPSNISVQRTKITLIESKAKERL